LEHLEDPPWYRRAWWSLRRVMPLLPDFLGAGGSLRARWHGGLLRPMCSGNAGNGLPQRQSGVFSAKPTYQVSGSQEPFLPSNSDQGVWDTGDVTATRPKSNRCFRRA
jgi:hypothetical protein